MKNKEAKSIFSSLDDFSSIPPPELWDAIEAQLEKPKKKKRALVWWTVAASLVVGLSIPTILYFNSNQSNILELNIENNGDGVVLQNDLKTKKNSNVNERETRVSNNAVKMKSQGESSTENSSAKNKQVLLGNSNSVATKTDPVISTSTNGNSVFSNLNTKKNKSGIVINDKSATNEIVSNVNSFANSSKSSSVGQTTSSFQKSNSDQNNETILSIGTSAVVASEHNKGKVANSSKSSSVGQTISSFQKSNSDQNNETILSIGTSAVVASEHNKGKVGNSSKSSSVGQTTSSFQKSNSDQNNETILSRGTSAAIASKLNNGNVENVNSKSIASSQNSKVLELNNKVIAENTNTQDSLTTIKKEVAQLEQALADLDKDKSKKKTESAVIDKWSLQVFAGLMSSDNFTNEKALGSTVASKQSSGYGVKTNYKLNKKWAVSSGFKINELGQKIEGVSYYERGDMNTKASGVFPLVSNNSPQNSIIKNTTIVFVYTNKDYLYATDSKTNTSFETGNVTQNLKYFEMPLEISYALLNKKKTYIGMNTGGFVGKLISNDVLLNGNSIGENNNVNEFVYGTVLSSTLQYEFFKKTKFFIEPGMNYYINPLENQSFNQFQWMFNVGLNVSF
jgi:hypothetical protein